MYNTRKCSHAVDLWVTNKMHGIEDNAVFDVKKRSPEFDVLALVSVCNCFYVRFGELILFINEFTLRVRDFK